MEKGETINWYIKTTRKKYVINFTVSSIISFSIFTLFYLKSKSVFGSVIFFLLVFLPSFRLMEYIFTRKSIWRYFFHVQEGETALFSAVTELIIVCFLFFLVFIL